MDPNVVIIILIVLVLLAILGDRLHKIMYGKDPNKFIECLYNLNDKGLDILDNTIINMNLQDINSYDEFRANIVYAAEESFKEALVKSTNESIDMILIKYNLSNTKLDEIISKFISDLIDKNDFETIIKCTYDKLIEAMNK